MKTIRILILACITMFAMSSSCEKDSTSDPDPTLPLTVTIKMGQQQSVGPFTVKVTQIEEHRCNLEDCSLCYGGYVTVHADITPKDQPTQQLTFARISCLGDAEWSLDTPNIDLKQIQGYNVGLINITDLRRINPIKISDYIVKLAFKKQ